MLSENFSCILSCNYAYNYKFFAPINYLIVLVFYINKILEMLVRVGPAREMMVICVEELCSYEDTISLKIICSF